MRRLKNALFVLLVRLAPVPKRRLAEERRFLVVSTTALGDTLWATPALESLRRSFPASRIAALTSRLGSEVLENNPWVDRCYLLTRWWSAFCLWKKLHRERFDTVLVFHASQRWVLPLAALLGAPVIVGTAGMNKGLDCLLTHPLPRLFQHEIERRLQMVERVGGKTYVTKLSFFLDGSAAENTTPLLKEGGWFGRGVKPLPKNSDVNTPLLRDRPTINAPVPEEKNGSDLEDFSAAGIALDTCKGKSSRDESIFPSRTGAFIVGRSLKERVSGDWMNRDVGAASRGIRIAIHPGSKDCFKRWPLSHFREVGLRLQERLSCEIFITGTREERVFMQELARAISRSRVVEVGSVAAFASFLQGVDLMITNDTGSLHLACALERPVIALFAPTDPRLCGPYRAACARVVARRPTCTPCLNKKCREPFCLLQIGVDEVFETALQVLA